MKKIISLAIMAIIGLFPVMSVSAVNTYIPKKSQNYISGPKGGCYYWNKKGHKTYVARTLCKK